MNKGSKKKELFVGKKQTIATKKKHT